MHFRLFRQVVLLSAALVALSLTAARVSASGGPTAPPGPTNLVPTQVDATLEDETITVTWRRPAGLLPGSAATYWLRLNGALEWVERSVDTIVHVTFPRIDPGRIHAYTVQLAGRATPISAPGYLSVPVSEDTEPPTAPRWTVGFDEPCLALTWEILDAATDDTTPRQDIRYEARDFDVIAGDRHIMALDFPRSGVGLETIFGVSLPEEVVLRAVDDAGNRSMPVTAEIARAC